ncbi:DUF222 domain-containing protein [Terrabacter sp. 2YAF2]|uniref:DUF222 domain-containing protein n=1 Tax=Terrabacter sp. 2YAF2 TaxID=3233026 RepID=UPI003F989B7E
MAPEPSTLELLRSRLADLEARQRAAGGASEPEFWERFAGRMPSPSTAPAASTAPDASTAPVGKGRRRTRRVAPESRPVTAPQGPWSELSAESLDSLDLREMKPLSEAEWHEMVNDPAWIEATAERAAAHRDDCADSDRQQAIAFDAVAGFSLDRHSSTDLTAAAELVAHQRRNHEVTLVNIVSELVSRGVEAPEGLTRADWLRSHDPSLTAGQAKAFVTVDTALADARWARLRLLVATQQVTVGNAAQIVDFHGRTAPVADRDDLTTALDDLTDQARQLRPEELNRLVRHHTEQIKPPRDEDALDRGRRDARGLWFTQPNATGMVGLRGVLDPEGAAILKSAIDPLSIPCPEMDEQGRTVTPDDRTPARRRMDALLAIVQRGVASADGVPTTDKAKVVVLIDLDDLLADLHDDIPEAFRRKGSSDASTGTCAGGRPRTGSGSGVTLTGDVLSPGVVRRMACDAEIIPMVLGADGEPLDVGRRRRLFTRGQRLALIARDKGCSWTGCTVPASWCDAHHVIHWRHGGRTSLLNAALLCPKHHTEVHDRGLTATVTALGVTWHT